MKKCWPMWALIWAWRISCSVLYASSFIEFFCILLLPINLDLTIKLNEFSVKTNGLLCHLLYWIQDFPYQLSTIARTLLAIFGALSRDQVSLCFFILLLSSFLYRLPFEFANENISTGIINAREYFWGYFEGITMSYLKTV